MMTIGMKSAAKNCTLPVHHMPSYIASILPTSGFAYEFARSLDFGHGVGVPRRRGLRAVSPFFAAATIGGAPMMMSPPSRSPERFVDTV